MTQVNLKTPAYGSLVTAQTPQPAQIHTDLPHQKKAAFRMRFRPTYIACCSFILLSACTEGVIADSDRVSKGQQIYAKECAACHGAAGEGVASVPSGLGIAPPDLVGLKQRNDGYFPREFVSRFIMGQLEKTDPGSPMPDFSAVGLRHVYPNGGADGEVLEADFANLLDYLEAIQD